MCKGYHIQLKEDAFAGKIVRYEIGTTPAGHWNHPLRPTLGNKGFRRGKLI
jgi:hypothetical protein